MVTCRKGREPLRRSSLFALLLVLAGLSFSPRPSSAAAAEVPYAWTGVERVVAVADLHGDYERFVFILQNPTVGILDEHLGWAGGKTHLVQLGDIMDRGQDAKKIFDLLIRLEKEAAEAGGMVHVLLGNHEEMNITGISLDYPHYVTVEQFVSFLPPDFRKAREAEHFRRLPAAERKRPLVEGPDAPFDERLRIYWQAVIDGRDPEARRAYVLGFNEAYGDWLIGKNIVIKINDIIYTHGGVSEALSKWPLREINTVMRTELEFFQAVMKNPQRFQKAFRPKLVYDPDSPLWFRGLASKNEQSAQAEVDRTLANLGARAVVVGHNYMRFNGSSPMIGREHVARFQDKVWIMDTGISGYYGGVPSALIYDKGQIIVWGETEEVAARTVVKTPPPSLLPPAAMERFLETAAIKEVEAGPAGRTAPLRVTLEAGGVVRQAIFKYIDRRRPDQLPDSFHYELAAYALAKHLGLTFVPPVVEREVEGMKGSLQAFAERTLRETERKERKLKPKDPAAFDRSMADLRVFANLVYDNCNDETDTLVRLQDGAVFRVDFSEAFAPKKGLVPRCDTPKCSRRLYARLLAWDNAAVEALLSPYLGADEIKALHARKDLIVRLFQKMIASRGAENVLF